MESTQSLSGEWLPIFEPGEQASGMFSGEAVLDILKLIFAGVPLCEVLTIIARLVEGQAGGMPVCAPSSCLR